MMEGHRVCYNSDYHTPALSQVAHGDPVTMDCAIIAPCNTTPLCGTVLWNIAFHSSQVFVYYIYIMGAIHVALQS